MSVTTTAPEPATQAEPDTSLAGVARDFHGDYRAALDARYPATASAGGPAYAGEAVHGACEASIRQARDEAAAFLAASHAEAQADPERVDTWMRQAREETLRREAVRIPAVPAPGPAADGELP